MLSKSSITALLSNGRNLNILFAVSLLLALTLRVKFEINFPHINYDYSHLALRTRNFLTGHGFTYETVSLENLSQVHYEDWNLWPIGFSILLIPFYYLTGSLVNGMVFIQVVGIILLIFGFIRIFKVLNLSKLTQSLFLLFTAFVPTPYSYLQTTDLLTAALFLWALALTIEICSEEKGNTWKLIAVCTLLFIATTLRYACISSILIIPGFFILYSFIKKDWKIFFTGLKILAFVTIADFIFFTIYKIPVGNYQGTDFIDNMVHMRLYWGLLKWFDAFPLKAFIYTAPIEFRLPLNQFILKPFRLAEYILSIIILGYLLWYFLKKRSWLAGLKEKSPIDIFTSLSVIAIIVIVFFLSLQTIFTEPILLQLGPHWMPKVYTFVFGTRYFVLLILLIQIFFFVLMDNILKNKIPVKYGRAFILLVLVPSMLFSITYWGLSAYQYHTGKDKYSYWNVGKDMLTVQKIINSDAEKNPGVHIVLATCWEPLFVIAGDPTMFSWSTTVTSKYDSIIQGKFKHTKPIILYTVMPETNLTEQEKKFISDFNAREVFQWQTGVLYAGGVLYRAYLQ